MKFVFANEMETKPSVDSMKSILYINRPRKQMFVGKDHDARIIKRDSVIMTLSNPDALFDNCLYPLFMEGSIDVKSLLKRNLDMMVSSNNIISLFQAVRILFTHSKYEKIYDTLLFEVDIADYLPLLVRIVEEKKMRWNPIRKGNLQNLE